MSDIDKIIEAINIPKRIVDGAESFLKKLFGTTIAETGQLIGDQIRFRRFKNQVVIFNKARILLESKSIKPNQINLKILTPLLDYSSLEEEETIQDIWSNVIANISSYDTEESLNLKCIEILKQITSDEIKLLDFFFEKFKAEERNTLERWKANSWLNNFTSVSPENSVFEPSIYKDILEKTEDQINLYVDRLVSFGLIKYEQPKLNESKENASLEDYISGIPRTIELKSYELETTSRVHFTNFGIYFVKLCKYEKLDKLNI